MISAEVLDAMVASGCTPEQISAVVKASCHASNAAAERRREKDRERKRASRVRDVPAESTLSAGNMRTVAESSGHADNGFSLSPVPLLPPTPPNNPLTPKPSSKNNQRGSRLPADWTMNGPDLAYALSKNLSEPEAFDLFERFCSWAWSASGANAVKVNWHQAWQGWVQREAGKIIATRASNRSQGPPEGKGGFVSILMDKHRERQNGTGTNEPEFFEH
jgi:hypothetical protein